MKSVDVRRTYIEFFKARGHAEIPSAPLVPENDPTTLFTSSGMQPLIPYLLGQAHPSGKRLVDSQKSFRAQDIEEVGDNRHTTFFEMLGNWSLGDYFKKEQLPWIWEFLTKKLGLDPKRLYVSVFEGNTSVPKDTESIEIWKEIFSGVGIDAKEGERIFTYPASKNWWSRAGEPEKMPPGEPGGPDSEVFFDFGTKHDPKYGKECHPNCECGRFMEIANSVFMQYQKQEDGSLKELQQKNVDFGGGLERLVAVTENSPDVFATDLFAEIIKTIEEYSGAKYSEEQNKAPIRVIADHLKAATFLIADGVIPSNKTQGYVLRRLLRRSAVKMHKLKGGLTPIPGFHAICESVMRTYDIYFDRASQFSLIERIITEEMDKFGRSMDRGLKEFEKATDEGLNDLFAFNLFQTYGFPLEISEELYKQKGKSIDKNKFDEIYKAHQELSRTAAKGMFKGGLADHNEVTTKLHTATHLLHEALHRVLGDHVSQKGSNITAERLRFDFSPPAKLTPDQIKKIEDLVNEKIRENLPVSFTTLPKDEAIQSGARAFFGERYGGQVKVYQIGNGNNLFSREICGGPHVTFTGVLWGFTIIKEESAGAGIRRIYATVTQDETARSAQFSSQKA